MSTKNKILALALMLTALSCSPDKVTKEENNYEFEKKSDYIYSKGNIYIGSEEYLNEINYAKKDDILVLDERNDEDPDIKIYDSHKIQETKLMMEILKEIKKYEENNPSKWNRSLESMRNEWMYHNLSYYLNYEVERTRDVDLNNADEQKYLRIIPR